MVIPDEWSSIVFGRGQNPAYRPSGFFFFILRYGDDGRVDLACPQIAHIFPSCCHNAKASLRLFRPGNPGFSLTIVATETIDAQ